MPPPVAVSPAHLTYWKYVTNSWGKPLQRLSKLVFIFFSLIFSYFCFLVAACSPCQGKLPRRKYLQQRKTNTKQNKDARSHHWGHYAPYYQS